MLNEGLKKYLTEEQLRKLKNTSIGIAGAGGLGSNVAMLLARSGIKSFVLIDDDVVDASNLNRQQFMPRHVGMLKVDALADIIHELDADINIDKYTLRLTFDNINEMLPKANHWVEAFDDAMSKRLFVEHALGAGYFTVSASGICGFGGPPMQRRVMGNLILVGDFTSDMAIYPPFAPRVMQAAAMQADAIITHILT